VEPGKNGNHHPATGYSDSDNRYRPYWQEGFFSLDISYKPLSALGPLYIAIVLHMAYRIWWLFPYMKYPDPLDIIEFTH